MTAENIVRTTDSAALAIVKELKELKGIANKFAEAAYAPETRRAYTGQWARFVEWCDARELAALPATPSTVRAYLAARATEGRKVASLGQALSAIGHAHRIALQPSPLTDPDVVDAWAGIRRELGTAQEQKAPVMVGHLRAMVEALPTTLRGKRDRAMLLFGFAGAFRRSELVGLTVADLTFTEEGVAVTLRRSKTDQEGKGRKVGLPYGSSPTMCPVRAVQAWLDGAGHEEGPLFRSVNRHHGLGGALDGRDVARLVKRAGKAAGLDPETVASMSGHSLRAGLVTSAAKANQPLHVIMKQTGHKSPGMVMRYIRDAELFKDNATNGLL